MVLQTVECLSGEHSFRQKRVSITGGDPLHPQNRQAVLVLAHELKKRDYFVHLEASGLSVDKEIFHIVDFISIDFKTPSTGVETPLHVLQNMIEEFDGKFQVKAVIDDEIDFKATFKAFNSLYHQYNGLRFHWVLTPAFGVNKPLTMSHFEWLLAKNEQEGSPFRVIGQQHKWVFGPKKEKV
jgi:7-carboxy-7-deazaguanine synthase